MGKIPRRLCFPKRDSFRDNKDVTLAFPTKGRCRYYCISHFPLQSFGLPVYKLSLPCVTVKIGKVQSVFR
jgi:hypothetical protein